MCREGITCLTNWPSILSWFIGVCMGVGAGQGDRGSQQLTFWINCGDQGAPNHSPSDRNLLLPGLVTRLKIKPCTTKEAQDSEQGAQSQPEL